MSGKNPVPQSQAYEGVRASLPPNVITSKGTFARDPNGNDKKGYVIGDLWVNTADISVWVLNAIVNNQAIWSLMGSGLTGGLVQVVTTGTTQQIVAGHSYISANAALSTFTLPVTANVGDSFEIIGQGAAFWTIAQNAGQSIKFNAATTTTGTGGSITSTQQFAVIDILCTVANTTWTVLNTSGAQAAYTIV